MLSRGDGAVRSFSLYFMNLCKSLEATGEWYAYPCSEQSVDGNPEEVAGLALECPTADQSFEVPKLELVPVAPRT